MPKLRKSESRFGLKLPTFCFEVELLILNKCWLFEPAFYDCWTRNKTFRWKLLYFVHCIYTKRPLSENGNKKTRVMKHIFVSFTNFDHLGANHRLCSGCDVYLHWSSTYTAPDLFIRKSEEYCTFFSPLPTNSRLKLLTYFFLEIQYIRSQNRLWTWICKTTIQLWLPNFDLLTDG